MLAGKRFPFQIMLALAVAVPLGFLFAGWTKWRRLNTVILHRIEELSDERLTWGLWLGIAGGVLWSWTRYAALTRSSLAWGNCSLSGWRIPRV